MALEFVYTGRRIDGMTSPSRQILARPLGPSIELAAVHRAARALLTDEWRWLHDLIRDNPYFEQRHGAALEWALDDLFLAGQASRMHELVRDGSQVRGARIYYKKVS